MKNKDISGNKNSKKNDKPNKRVKSNLKNFKLGFFAKEKKWRKRYVMVKK